MAHESVFARFKLRDLNLPARLVLSLFLISVGLGYFSALVQLHLKHSSKVGEALPTPSDVVEIFAGLKLHDPSAPPPTSKIEHLIIGDRLAEDISKENMAPAFFAKSKGWQAAIKGQTLDTRTLEAEREGERQAMLLWVRSSPNEKRTGYEDDRFALPTEWKTRAISPVFLTDKHELKIKSLVNARCQNCHVEQSPSLSNYAELESLVTAPSSDLIDGKWVRSSRQVSIEGLTQSTHAHLLSFSMLFTLTGLVFAFTSYPGLLRGILGPIVLMAQVLDITCWWMARVPNYGPYFAQAILVTGGIVGLGLALQIVLGLLNMYAWKGKAVVMLLLIMGGATVGFIAMNVVQPALDVERKQSKEQPKPVVEAREVPPQKVATATSQLERLICGPRGKELPFNGKGSMADAFYERDGADYKDIVKKSPAEKPRLDAERAGEQLALKFWLAATPDVRKKAYADDRFELPAEQVGKPITAEYLLESRAVKVKSIITDRCLQCHIAGAEQEDYPLDSYEQLMKYIPGKQ
jgi:hypothetical protein